MMHQDPTASHQFDTDTVSVVTTEGEASPLAFYDPSSTQAWLSVDEPLDLRDYREVRRMSDTPPIPLRYRPNRCPECGCRLDSAVPCDCQPLMDVS